MNTNFDTFMKNPYWKGIYENAPSEDLKQYFRIRFNSSDLEEDAACHGESAEEKLSAISLDKADIRYLLAFTRNGYARQFYRMFLDKLTGEHEGYRIKATVFQFEEWNPYFSPGGKYK